MKHLYSLRGLLTAVIALFALVPAMNAETLLCSYANGSMTNISISGTTVSKSVKYASNTTSVTCLQLANGYTTENVYNGNAINLICSDGFKAGDVVTIQGFINNKDASKRGAVKLISLGEGNKIVELNAFPDFINGYSSPDTPEKLTYTLVEDQPNLSLVRDGNTGTNLMFISVVRDPGTGGENPEPGPTPSGDHSVGMNTLNNQMLLQLGSGDVKYYNTADLAEVNIDKATGTVSVTPLAGDWNDEFKQNVTAIRFAKAPETGADAEISNKGVNITEAKGWLESVYAKWVPLEDASTYRVYIKGGKYSDYTRIDRELVRNYGSYGRVDMVGLPAGVYSLKVVPVIGGAEDESMASEAKEMAVKAYDRSGFAHFNNSGVGAYKDNGELKDDARVIYVTAETAKTVKCLVKQSDKDGEGTEFTGLQAIINAYQKGVETRPLAVRLIGTIRDSDMDALGSSAEGLQIKGKNNTIPMNITIEGIGDDATTWGFGFLLRNTVSVELRNFANMLCMDDCISIDTDNKYCWVHHLDLFYGNAGGDSDQAKGDGTVDIKNDSQYITVAYNRFHDSGKSSLCGMKSESGPNYIDYHHNWFDHSDSRHPRVRTMTVHVWNNYYDGCSKYGVGATTSSSVFVERNFFRHSLAPMMSSRQGTDAKGDGTFSGENGGIIKSFGNLYAEKGTADKYNVITHAMSATDFDCYEASSRDEKVPSTFKALVGGGTYDNFDTNPALMYDYTPLEASEVPAVVTGFYGAGRLNHGDFVWDLNYSGADTDYSVNTQLKAALESYKSTLVGIFE
ncbi:MULTISPECIES: pectate lyase [Duncaniella]|jgi:pectate lyase|uniref:pectate lyase family protein n=1 Tax=Duncaniella TaxID=2518495 RepID=UPI000A98F5CC|nr:MULTISPECIES: pectate lyase [Duncaniella]